MKGSFGGCRCVRRGYPSQVAPRGTWENRCAYRRALHVEALEDRRLLSTVTVNTSDDVVDPLDSFMSLREAIADESVDWIDFDPSVYGHTIELTGGVLGIDRTLTIMGPGEDQLTIDALHNGRVFDIVSYESDIDVQLIGLTLTGGNTPNSGGAIANGENLTITACTIEGSYASGEGGGIYNAGRLTVTASTIHNNSAGIGGGICNDGHLTVTASTIASNSAIDGGGIWSRTDLSGSHTSFVNCTISRNVAEAGGGLFNASGYAFVQYSTITDNVASYGAGWGGGVASAADSNTLTRLYSTIVAGNQYSDLDSVYGSVNSFSSNGYNLIGTGNATGAFSGAEPFYDHLIGAISPQLGPLSDNGGPTWTHALLPGSPAIDNGAPATILEFDQRGAPFGRTDQSGSREIDVGAYERQTVADLNLVVNTLDDVSDGVYEAPGHLSLREAIGLANGSAGTDDTVSFDASLHGGTILLRHGELRSTDRLGIVGPGADRLMIDASGSDPTPNSTLYDGDDTNDGDGSRIFNIDDGNGINNTYVLLRGLSLTGGDCGEEGGAIRSVEQLAVAECGIRDNAATRGGGIYSRFEAGSIGNLTVWCCTVDGNAATTDGGGLCNIGGEITVTASTLSHNMAIGRGGGIFSDTDMSGIYTWTCVVNSTISQNSASSGGGIYNFDGPTRIESSTITENVAPEGAGSGVASYGDARTSTEVVCSIIADNEYSDVDLTGALTANSFRTGGYNLIGTTGNGGPPDALAAFRGIGDHTNVTDPRLAPLADNGGPTWTHALLPGCLALDAGDQTILSDPNLTDQRGYDRVCDSNGDGYACIDIGAFEAQAVLATLLGDYNRDGRVNAADYVVWRNTDGNGVADVYAGADGNGNRVVDAGDYLVWRANFGRVATAPAAGMIEESLEVVPGSAALTPDKAQARRWEWFAGTEARRSTVLARAATAVVVPTVFDEWSDDLLFVALAADEIVARPR